MRRALAVLIGCLGLCTSAHAQEARSREILVDAVIATVEGRIITLSDVDAQAWITLLERGGTEALDRELDRAFREPVLDYLIKRELILVEAERNATVEVAPDEVAGAIAALESRFENAAAFDKFLFRIGLDRDRLTMHLGRSLTADRYVGNRLRLTTRVTDTEARAYYQKHKDRLGGRSFGQVKALIVERLTAEKSERELQKWFTQLRRRATVRILESL